MKWWKIIFCCLLLTACNKKPLLNPPPSRSTTIIEPNGKISTPTPAPTPPFPTPPPLLGNPEGPVLTRAGINLITDFETGGKAQYEKNPHPELPDLRYSGVTIGWGYDLHQYSKPIILSDWFSLPQPNPQRLSET